MSKKNTFDFLTQKNLIGLYQIEGEREDQFKDLSEIKFNELERIDILMLWDNQLSDISPLKELKNLEELDIKGNPVPAEQIEALKKALPGCSIGY
jgi:Leucine-rich repeat (LRR) protein